MASVVVAEDNLEHQRAIVEVVRRLGHTVTVAPDGRSALTAVTEQLPDLVIADVDMPHLDGLQLCHAMREDPRVSNVPVVLITAYLSPGDPRMTTAGAAAVVSKPYTITELTDTLRAHLGGAAPMDAVTDQPSSDGEAPDAGSPGTGSPGARRPGTGSPGTGSPATRSPDAGSPDAGTSDRGTPDTAGAGDTTLTDALLDSLDTAVAGCDVTGRPVVSNQALRTLFGEDGDHTPMPDWPERFRLRHPDGSPLPAHEMPLLRALAGEHVHHEGLLARDRRNRPRWLSIDARPVQDAAGATVGAVAAVHDVTAEHRAVEYQRCQEDVVRILAAPPRATTADDVLAAIAAALGWTYLRWWLVDPVTDRLREVATFAAAGRRPPADPAAPARGEGLAGLCWQRGELVWVPDIRADDSPIRFDADPDDEYRAAGAVPIPGGESVIGVLTFCCDDPQEPDPTLAVLLTGIAGHLGGHLARRRVEDLVRQLSASTDEYISLVGHELRTPLTSIGAYTDLIAESPDPTPVGDVRDLLHVIDRNNASLRGLVDQLLDLATLESDYGSLTLGTVDLAVVVTDAVAAATPAARDRRVALHTDLPAAMPLTGDAGRLRQVVDHLVDNAVKFSHDGSTITVAGSVDAGTAELTIADTGVGVDHDEHALLFRSLYRANNARHRSIPGKGLGLALSRAIVERHHGTITLTSAPSAGTTVTVRLPLTARQSAATTPTRGPEGERQPDPGTAHP